MILTSLIAATTILSTAPQDTWELKSPFTKGYEATYTCKVNVDAGGQQLEANFNQLIKVADGGSGKPWKGTITWLDIMVDGNAAGDPPPWDVKWSEDGSVFATPGDMGDDIRRMLAPLTFLYTGKPVAKGNAWKTQVKAEEKSAPVVEYNYESLGQEAVNGKDAMKFKVTMKEVADEGVSADGTWWVAKNGVVVKFEMSIKDWLVPMAGDQRMAAKVVGTLKG
ncbi:MAG: hypothetical protein KF784_09070 [Fimbriimonadaceae bacterium]|nr:hypothetical protein [Fimbriimonadaceae bacterium]